MNDDKDFLGKEPVGRLLLKLALPTVAAQVINMLYNIVDRIYIGHIPEVGSLALTGVGVCMPLIKTFKRRSCICRKDTWELFCGTDRHFSNFDSGAFNLEP